MVPPFSTRPEHYDFVIIGSGPAGQKAAICAAKAGKRALVVEWLRLELALEGPAAALDVWLGLEEETALVRRAGLGAATLAELRAEYLAPEQSVVVWCALGWLSGSRRSTNSSLYSSTYVICTTNSVFGRASISSNTRVMARGAMPGSAFVPIIV